MLGSLPPLSPAGHFTILLAPADIPVSRRFKKATKKTWIPKELKERKKERLCTGEKEVNREVTRAIKRALPEDVVRAFRSSSSSTPMTHPSW